ncbi:MAG: NfeD family protein [Bdellovibrio sp.]|nr:NfeD family protein [Bdellovibrio sp.]
MVMMLQDNLWLQFLAVGLVLVLAEAVVPGFVILPIGLGFIITAGAAAFTNNLFILVPILIVAQFAAFFFVRKYLKEFAHLPRARTTADGMIGAEASVIEPIAPGKTGYVKLYGDTWQARSYSERELRVGTLVTITKMDGNKVWVQPLNEET